MLLSKITCLLLAVAASGAFQLDHHEVSCRRRLRPLLRASQAIESVAEASRVLAEWDRYYNQENSGKSNEESSTDTLRPKLPDAVRTLNVKATEERDSDPTTGRCMLGICASSIDEGIATLKSWVTNLELPRGLLHGADRDGVPLEFNGGVYIKVFLVLNAD